MPRWSLPSLTSAAAAAAILVSSAAAGQSEGIDEEIVVFGQGRPRGAAGHGSPASVVVPEALVSVNAATTEDLVKYEPGLVIRRRFIGDPNGTMGMRGSNMFQTARSMVFADGLPLHYFLQTQYNGSPRWSLVAADEVAFIEVIEGPFSAQWSGNAMGGVVNIETKLPAVRRMRLEGSLFRQSFDEAGFDDGMSGSRVFASYGDKAGALSVYGAYTRLENSSQPLDYLFARTSVASGGETPASGSIAGVDEYGQAVRYFGNTGRQASTTDQLKAKVGYELGGWFALGTVAYERRGNVRGAVESYLRGADGEPIFDATVLDGGEAFTVRGGDFAVAAQDRDSLLAGARLQGTLPRGWWLEAAVSYFDVLHDETRTSERHPADPAFEGTGSVTVFDETGWRTAEVKLRRAELLGSERLSLLAGYRRERFGLEIDHYRSDDYAAGATTTLATASGGTTEIEAAYAELAWQAADAWDVEIGGRYESWRSRNGFFDDYARNELQSHPDRADTRFSPKLSAGFEPNESWRFRYSLARAYRFPIVEELFQNERRTTGTSMANAGLEPEDGLHRNVMLERGIDGGYVRFSVFDEVVDDVIFNQTAIVDNRRISTFLPIDRVRTRGVELVYNRMAILGKLDLRFNATRLDAEIVENRVDPSIEGNAFPRMPDWRVNVLATYHVNGRWDVGGGIRFASDSFGDLDNSDIAKGVFGAQDGYSQLDLRATYALTSNIELHVGVDNATDQIAYVHHPWPGRTLFVEASFDFEEGR